MLSVCPVNIKKSDKLPRICNVQASISQKSLINPIILTLLTAIKVYILHTSTSQVHSLKSNPFIYHISIYYPVHKQSGFLAI